MLLTVVVGLQPAYKCFGRCHRKELSPTAISGRLTLQQNVRQDCSCTGQAAITDAVQQVRGRKTPFPPTAYD